MDILLKLVDGKLDPCGRLHEIRLLAILETRASVEGRTKGFPCW